MRGFELSCEFAACAGGWVLGGLETETSLITYLCVGEQSPRVKVLTKAYETVGARCIVLTTDYRLAPENKFPAAVEDAVEVLQWVLTNGKAQLNIDTLKIATGGGSA